VGRGSIPRPPILFKQDRTSLVPCPRRLFSPCSRCPLRPPWMEGTAAQPSHSIIFHGFACHTPQFSFRSFLSLDSRLFSNHPPNLPLTLRKGSRVHLTASMSSNEPAIAHQPISPCKFVACDSDSGGWLCLYCTASRRLLVLPILRGINGRLRIAAFLCVKDRH
jgi:hypothetical protein